MTDLAVLADEPAALDQAADPTEFVVLACERAKTWLAQALEQGDIGQIVEMKAQADAIRVYTAQREIGRDAELAACEIVRRAERGIGLAIRKGQAEGTIRKKGNTVYRPGAQDVGDPSTLPAGPSDLTGMDRADLTVGPYAVTDGVPDEVFEEAIAEAKAEGKLTRANVVRKVKAKRPDGDPMDRLREATARQDPTRGAVRVAKAKEMAVAGHTSRQIAETLGIEDMAGFKRRHGIDVPADRAVGKTRRIDPNRVVSETVITLEGLAMGLDHVDPTDLDADQIEAWHSSMFDALTRINRFRKAMKEQIG